jgi:hypothetical protein
MFPVITNIYKKKDQITYLNGIVHSHRKPENVFIQLEMFDVCSTIDTAYIDTIFNFMPHTRQYGFIDIPHCLKARIIAAVKNVDAPMLTHVWQELEYRIDVCRVNRGAHIEHL